VERDKLDAKYVECAGEIAETGPTGLYMCGLGLGLWLAIG